MHDPDEAAWVVLAIAWPFALSAVLAHLGLTFLGRRTSRVLPEGVVVLAVTYSLGMFLRALSGRGLAPGFVVVAAVFSALTMLIYSWRRQDRINRGEQPGLTSAEHAELAAARKRIRDLETELAVSKRSVELLREEASPKGGTRRSK